MNIWDIAKKVGGEIIKDTIPMGGVILSAVNEFLPDNEKLGMTATGLDIQNTISKLSSSDQEKLLSKKFDLDIVTIKEDGSTTRAMLEAETKSTHSTRPKIALGAFYLVTTATMLIITGWLYAVLSSNTLLVKSITDGWVFVAALLAPFIGWLNNYFGILKSEHENRLRAVLGKEPKNSKMDFIKAIINK